MRKHPDLEQLKRQSKELLAAFRAADAAAVNEVNAGYDDPQRATFALHDAQLVIARSYGFDSWPKLKAYVDGVTIRRLVEAVRIGDLESVRTMLKARPELANMAVSYGDEHRAIHYAVMHREPEITRVLMQNGADARAGIHPHRDATSAWTLARERGYDDILTIIQEEEKRRANLHTSQLSLPPRSSMARSAPLWQMVTCNGCAPVWRKANSPIMCTGATAAY
jgi:hypothetical protein